MGYFSKSYQKLFASAMSAALVTSSVVTMAPLTAGAAEIQSFSDVKPTDYFYEAVHNLSAREIIKGYEDGTYRPYASVTRAQAAKILALTLGLDTTNVINPGFTDVKSSDWYYGPVAALVEKGILQGYGDKFKPAETLTRAQMAKILTLGFNFGEHNLTNNPFKDVQNDDWFAPYLPVLISEKITTGRTPDTFDPYATVTRGQMAAFVFRSEATVKHNVVTSEIVNITNSSIELKDGTYLLSEDQKKWLNPSNATALKGAIVKLRIKDGTIENVDSLEITANGSESTDNSNRYKNHIVLDGKDAAFTGSLKINGDFVSVKNLTINGDLEIGKEVQRSFYTKEVTVEGNTIISETEKFSSAKETNNFYKSLAYRLSGESFKAASEDSPIIVFEDTRMNSIEVSKSGVTIESKGTTSIQDIRVSSTIVLKADKGIAIQKLTVGAGTSEVTIDAVVDELLIDTNEDITVNGQGDIKNVVIQSGKEINLNTEGKVDEVETKSKDSKIKIGKNTKIGNIVVPEGSKAEDVIEDYNDVKRNIEKINGKKNPDSSSKYSNRGGSRGSSSNNNNNDGNNENDSSEDTDSPDVTAPVISSIDSLSFTVTKGEAFTLPAEVTAKLNNDFTGDYEVTWKPSTVNTEEIGQFEFLGTVEGFDEPVILLLTVTPDGLELKDDGKTAVVSTDEAFTYAIEQPAITKVEIIDSLTASYEGTVNKEIVIPEDVQDETINFSDLVLPNLAVYGDHIQIQSATVHNLLIGESVTYLTLHDVVDAENSEHTFDGGGGESIVLTGNTTFKGNIRITSGTDIQVRAESPGAKIEGTIWIESDAPTKIAAPVSNVVINSDNEDIVIKSVVENLIMRSDATIELVDGAAIENATKRIGVEVVAKTKDGTPVIFTEVLDKYELQRYLFDANHLIQNIEIGEKEGNVPQSAADLLQAAIDQAENVNSTGAEVTKETQDLIDTESSKLQEALVQFKNSTVKVEKEQLVDEWQRAQRLANRVSVGNEPGQYPEEGYEELLGLIQEADQMYHKFGLSQKEIDNKVKEIQEFIAYFLTTEVEDGKNDDPLAEGTISFIIEGEKFKNDWADVEIISYTGDESSNDDVHSETETTVTENGLRIDVTDIDETVNGSFYAIIRTNGYLFIEKFSGQDVVDETSRKITVDGKYTPIQVKVPGIDEADTEYRDDLSLNLADDTGMAILTAHVSPGTYIPFGTYNIHYNAAREEATYSLFKNNVVISESNNIVEFSENELALLTMEVVGSNAVNYKLDGVVPIYSLGDKYDVIRHPDLEEGVSSIYLTKNLYDSLDVYYAIEKDQKHWRLHFDLGQMDIQGDQTVTIDDQLKIDAEWDDFVDKIVDTNKPLSYYLQNLSITNAAGNWVNGFETVVPDEWGYSRTGYVDGEVTIIANGKTYSKKVEDFQFTDLSVSEITNGEITSGEVELVFSVNDSPIDIEPFKTTITVGDEGTTVLGTGAPGGEVSEIPSTGPELHQLMIEGLDEVSNEAIAGTTLTAGYVYLDPEGTEEGETRYQWFRADDEEGTNKVEIPGATGKTYQPTSEDVRKFISVEVTPVDENGSAGATVSSAFEEVKWYINFDPNSTSPRVIDAILGSGNKVGYIYHSLETDYSEGDQLPKEAITQYSVGDDMVTYGSENQEFLYVFEYDHNGNIIEVWDFDLREQTEPEGLVSEVAFTDIDADLGEIEGVVTWTLPADQSNVEGYSIYFLDHTGEKLSEKIGEVEVGEDTYTITANTPVPNGAIELGVFANYFTGESEVGATIAFKDWSQ